MAQGFERASHRQKDLKAQGSARSKNCEEHSATRFPQTQQFPLLSKSANAHQSQRPRLGVVVVTRAHGRRPDATVSVRRMAMTIARDRRPCDDFQV